MNDAGGKTLESHGGSVDWLGFISSLAWPLVAVGALIGFRRSLASWFQRVPSRVRAGPVVVEWEQTIDAAVSDLTASSDGETNLTGNGQPENVVEADPASPLLALRLRDIAKVSPVGAITQAFQEIEEEIYYLLLTTDRSSEQRLAPFKALLTLRARELVPEQAHHLLDRLRQLRNIAVHAVEPIGATQALEFLALADEAIRIIRPIRQQRELDIAMEEINRSSAGK